MFLKKTYIIEVSYILQNHKEIFPNFFNRWCGRHTPEPRTHAPDTRGLIRGRKHFKRK